MSDGIVIPLDVDDSKAKGKIARLKKDAGDAGRAYGQAGSNMARMGGPAGGIMSRGLGGFASGTASGLAGLTATAVGIGLNALMARDSERVAAAREREVRAQARESIARNAMERTDQMKAGGASFLQTIRSAGFRGVGVETLKGYTSMANDWGLSSEQGVGIWEAANDNKGVDPNDIAKGLAAGVLGNDPKAVAASIMKFNGLNNAIAAAENISPEQAGAAVEAMRSNPLSIAAGEIGNAMNPVQNAQIDAAINGDAGASLRRQAKDILNPAQKMMVEAATSAFNVVKQLQAAAADQGDVARRILETANFFALGEGSANQQLIKGARAAAE
jgi:hypothetical protein